MSELEKSIRDIIRNKIYAAPAVGAEPVDVLATIDRAQDHAALVKMIVGILEAHPTDRLVIGRIKNIAPRVHTDSIYEPTGDINHAFLFKNAEILLKAKDYSLSKNIYQTLHKSGQFTAEALLGLAKSEQGLGNHAQAQHRFEESIAYRPTAEAFDGLIQLLLSQSKSTYAAEVLERALKQTDLSVQAEFNYRKALGNCYLRQENIVFAEQAYRRAIELVPTADDVQSNLGSLYLQAGKIPQAKAAFQDAVSSNPENAAAQLGLGCVSLVEKNKEFAHQCFIESLKCDPKNPRAIFYLIKTAYELRKFEEAERIVSSFVQNAPVNPSLLYSLAGMQFHVAKKAECIATVRKILQIKPDHRGANELWVQLGSKT